NRALRLDEPRDAGQLGHVLIFPDAQILWRNPSFRRHRAGLGEHQPRAAHRPRSQVHEMPVVGKTVVARILAHRRDDDAVAERDVADLQFGEEHALYDAAGMLGLRDLAGLAEAEREALAR